MRNFKNFTKFALIWYSQQFAIPFWIVGHVHLHINDYSNTVEIFSSIVMHLAVITGFWLDWNDYKKSND